MAYSDDLALQKIRSLTPQQDSIQAAANWIMFHKRNAKQSVDVWFREFQKANENVILNMVYLANEVLQTSRKKGPEFVDEFFKVLQSAFDFAFRVCSPPIAARITRVVRIWQERGVFNHAFCENLLSSNESSLKQDLSKSIQFSEIQKNLKLQFNQIHEFFSTYQRRLDEFKNSGYLNSDRLRLLKAGQTELYSMFECHKKFLDEITCLVNHELQNSDLYENIVMNCKTVLANSSDAIVSTSSLNEIEPLNKKAKPELNIAPNACDSIEPCIPIPTNYIASSKRDPQVLKNDIEESLEALSNLIGGNTFEKTVADNSNQIANLSLLNNILSTLNSNSVNEMHEEN